jgi:hypothetical protein
MDQGLEISFSSGGLTLPFHLGVCEEIKGRIKDERDKFRYSGVSAGAIAAVVMACGINTEWVMKLFMDVVEVATTRTSMPFSNILAMSTIVFPMLRKLIWRILPSDAYVICSGKVALVMTAASFQGKEVVVKHYDSNEMLVECMMASCHIPMISGFRPYVVRGIGKCYDGYFVHNHPQNNWKGFKALYVSTSPLRPGRNMMSHIHLDTCFAKDNIFRIVPFKIPEIYYSMYRQGVAQTRLFLYFNTIKGREAKECVDKIKMDLKRERQISQLLYGDARLKMCRDMLGFVVVGTILWMGLQLRYNRPSTRR